MDKVTIKNSFGFYDEECVGENRWRWCSQKEANIEIENPSDANRVMEVCFFIKPAPTIKDGSVKVFCNQDFLFETSIMDRENKFFISVPANGKSNFVFKYDGQFVTGYKEDCRTLGYRLLNLHVKNLGVSLNEVMQKALNEADLKNNETLAHYVVEIAKGEYKKKIVLYGYGKVGKWLFETWKEGHVSNIVAICDNSVDIHSVESVPVLKHYECINQYPNSLYVVTVQNGFSEILLQLLKDGIPFENIYFWDNKQKKIIG